MCHNCKEKALKVIKQWKCDVVKINGEAKIDFDDVFILEKRINQIK